MFAIIFVWTPPHFWALALFRADEYAAAGVPMLPVVAGPERTKRYILWYAIALAPLAVAPAALGFATAYYGACAAVLGALFVACALRTCADPTNRAARGMFRFSIFYLFAIFALLIADKHIALAG